jgi:hypothetical protein
MTTFTKRFDLRTITLSLLTATLLPIASSHAGAATQPQAAMTLTEGLAKQLAELGDYFGDRSGFIGLTITGTQETLYVAVADRGPFAFYVTGQDVGDEAEVAACSVDSSGGVDTCDDAYGETLLFTLGDLQDQGADPAGFTIACHKLLSNTSECRVTWLDGSSSCYLCSGGSCTRTPC